MSERGERSDEETLDLDVAAFARGWDDEEGTEAGLGGGAGDLGASGDLSRDHGTLDDGDAEGTPP